MKRRSATSSPPEPVFFSDENLGRKVFPAQLREAGVHLEVHRNRVLRLLRRHRPPFIAKMYAGGRVKVWLEEDS